MMEVQNRTDLVGLLEGMRSIAPIGGGSTGVSYVQPGNLSILWDAESISATNGQSLSSWTDSISGISTAGTPSGQPTYKTNAANGKPAVHFAGSQYFELGRPAALMSALSNTASYTLMIVASNLVAGANALAAIFGEGNAGGGQWYVLTTANVGRYNGGTVTNSLATTDLYVMFYTYRNGGAFQRYMAGVNGTSINPDALSPGNGSQNWAIGTGLHDTTTNGNTYSFRGDIFRIAIWNTNLSFTDVIRQTRNFHTYFGKPMPWAGLPRYVVYDGNSITQGIGGVRMGNYPWFCSASMGLKLGQWTNTGRSGATLTQLADDYAFQFTGLSGSDALNIPMLVVWNEYGNMRGSSAYYTDTVRYATQLKTLDSTAKSAWWSSSSLGGSVGVFGQVGDQTALGAVGTNPSTIGTHRITYSDFFTNTPDPHMDAVIPVHQDLTIGQLGANQYSGTWPTTDFYDNNHPVGAVGQSTANGYAHLSSLITPIISPMITS
jgi:hypothetical protein